MEKTPNEPLVRLKDSHTRDAIKKRLLAGHSHSYLRDFVYGAIDGSVTTFAVVSAVAGADLSTGVVIILGAANLLGDGFSMAAGSFLATRAQEQEREKARRVEELHIEHFPEGEREEIRQIFARKGFAGNDLERAVSIITSNVKQWVDTMMLEELGLSIEGPSPIRAAFSTFAAFVLLGLVPLLPFFLLKALPGLISSPFAWSVFFTEGAFFLVGALKGRFVAERWYLAGLETLAVGSVAAFLSYVVGLTLKTYLGHT